MEIVVYLLLEALCLIIPCHKIDARLRPKLEGSHGHMMSLPAVLALHTSGRFDDQIPRGQALEDKPKPNGSSRLPAHLMIHETYLSNEQKSLIPQHSPR